MAQGRGIPTLQQSGGGYPPSHVNGALRNMGAGRGVPITSRDYKGTTPTSPLANTPLTHQGVTVRSGR